MLMRIELGANPAEAIALQKKMTMKATGKPVIEDAVVKPNFTNSQLPGVEAFDKTEEILASEADINPGMIDVREKASAVAKAAADRTQRARIDEVIRKQAIPAFHSEILKMGKVENGWMHPRVVGNYRTDYVMRTITNYAGIWANNSKEVVYFAGQGLDGSQTLYADFPERCAAAIEDALFLVGDRRRRRRLQGHTELAQPVSAQQAVAVAIRRRRIADARVSRPKQPDGIPESNWLPTPQGKKYNVTYRFYGPTKDVTDGKYFPPPLVRISQTRTEQLIRSLKKSRH